MTAIPTRAPRLAQSNSDHVHSPNARTDDVSFNPFALPNLDANLLPTSPQKVSPLVWEQFGPGSPLAVALNNNSDSPTTNNARQFTFEDAPRARKAVKKDVMSPRRRVTESAVGLRKMKVKVVTKLEPKKPSKILEKLHFGTPMLRVPRKRGNPQFKFLQLSNDNCRIQWYSARKKLQDTCVPITNVVAVNSGQTTECFKRLSRPELTEVSFSIIYYQDHQTYTLDLIAKTKHDCIMWYNGLAAVFDIYRKKRSLVALKKVVTLDCDHLFDEKKLQEMAERRRQRSSIRVNRDARQEAKQTQQFMKDFELLEAYYHRVKQKSQDPALLACGEYENVMSYLALIEERMSGIAQDVQMKFELLSLKRDVWDANTDLKAVEEKIKVLVKEHNKSKDKGRKSLFW